MTFRNNKETLRKVSFETSDFSILDDLMEKEPQKNSDDENNPRVKELFKEIYSTNDYYKIIQLCARIHEHDPDNIRAFIHQAEQFHYLKEFEKAEESFQKAIEKANGTSAYAFAMYAIFLMDRNVLDLALEYCDKAIKISKNDLKRQVLHVKGEILCQVGEYQKALECLDESLGMKYDEKIKKTRDEMIKEQNEFK